MNVRIFAAVLGGLVVVSSLASAEERGDRDRHEGAREHDGRWQHGRHDGRDGWWWVVGNLWYYYPRQVAVVPPPPVVGRPPAIVYSAPPPASVYYYCARPRGYYPAIPDCPTGWQIVREQ